LDPNSDAWTGWGTGGGNSGTPQAIYAIAFYKAALDAYKTEHGVDATNVTLTGHSLGGGLAGFVASLYHKDAYIFDNMTFELASAHAYARSLLDSSYREFVYGSGVTIPPLPDASGVVSMAIEGELLFGLRNSIGVGADFPDKILEIDPSLLDSVPLNWLDRHVSQALVVLRLFADDEWDSSPELAVAAKFAFPGLYSDAVAKSFGFADHDPNHTASYVMSNFIAGSVQAEAGGAYGNSAASAMFQDMHDLGNAYMVGGLSFASGGNLGLRSLPRPQVKPAITKTF